MEILIPGLILVALMVYASTRIKRTAAEAFEAETIETDDFVIQKPDGFLNNLNGDPKYAFQTYSKEFGIAATDVRQGRVELIIRSGVSVNEVVGEITATGNKINEDLSEVIGSTHYRLLEAERIEKDVELLSTYKITEKNGQVYVLEAVRLAETSYEFARKLETFVASFELK